MQTLDFQKMANIERTASRKRTFYRWLLFITLGIFALYYLAPLYVMIITTLKSMEEVTKFSDLYSPFADTVFDRLWASALGARDKQWFKTTPIRKAIYAQGIILIPLAFSLSSWAFYSIHNLL